jgi:hypothetical protein
MEADDFGSPWAASFRSRYEEFDEPIKIEDKQMKENKDNFIAAVEEAKQRLAAGEKPKNVFDVCFPFDEGLAEVKLNSKWNYINRNGDILSDVWFDRCYDFYDGFACVVVNGKGNYIDCGGKLISDTWFDDCGFFYDGFAAVKLNGKWNFISREGKYLSDTWFDDCGNFIKGFTYVKSNGIRYLLRKDGVLCDWNTKEPIKPDHSVSPDTDYKKKYEQALERAKNYHEGHTLDVNLQAAMEYVFPELQESEDEKVRKRIIRVFKGEIGLPTKEETKKYIAWLEKQGEQKPTDKVEPKFKVGDSIRYKNSGAVFTIKSVFSDHYSLTNNEGLLYFMFQDKYELVEQKSAWSEEDDIEISVLINALRELETYGGDFSKEKNWLESLKERMK